MKLSKWIVVALAVLALGLMLTSAYFGWNTTDTLESVQRNWREPYHPEFAFPFDVPPLVSVISSLATIYLLSIIVSFLLPANVAVMSDQLRQPAGRLLRYIFLGILCGIFLGAIAIGSAFTFLTFPMTIVLGLAVLISSFFGTVAIYYTVGDRLLRWAKWETLSPLYRLLIGMLVLNALVYIPFLGDLLKMIYASLGLGVAVATRFGTGKTWSLRPLLMEPRADFSVEDSKKRRQQQE